MSLSWIRYRWRELTWYAFCFFLLVSGYDSYVTCPSYSASAQSIVLAALGLLVYEIRKFNRLPHAVQNFVGFLVLSGLLYCLIATNAPEDATEPVTAPKSEPTFCSDYLVSFAIIVRCVVLVLWALSVLRGFSKARFLCGKLAWRQRTWYALCCVLLAFGWSSYVTCPAEESSIVAQSIALVAGVLVIFEIFKLDKIPDKFKYYNGYGLIGTVLLSLKQIYKTEPLTEEQQTFCFYHLLNFAVLLHFVGLMLLARRQFELLPIIANLKKSKDDSKNETKKVEVENIAEKTKNEKKAKLLKHSQGHERKTSETSKSEWLKFAGFVLVYISIGYFMFQ